ncbi:DegT/DnrJ/EryC1/StrS family aminotransferase, partial [Azospirillum isscasi]
MIPRLRPPFSLSSLLRAALPADDAVEERFERAFAEAFGFSHGLFFPYGRSALYALLKGLGWADREVLCPAYTCSVVPHAIVLSGNRIRFADSGINHFNVSPDALATALRPETAMVVLTPLFGYPLDRAACHAAIAARAPGAFVLYDLAQGFGAQDADGLQAAGADAALFSFGIGKMMSTFYGGMLLLKDKTVHEAVRDYRNRHFAPALPQGAGLLLYGLATWLAFREPALTVVDRLEHGTSLLDRFTKYYYATDRPRLPEDALVRPTRLQSRLGLRELAHYQARVEARRAIARHYEERLGCEGVAVFGHSATPTYSVFPLAVADPHSARRALAARGIQVGTLIDYACPDLPGYELHAGTGPRARVWGRSMINLPNWPGMSRPAADRTVDALLHWRDEAARR